MEIPKFYSDAEFEQFENLINPDIVNALKLRGAVFLDLNQSSQDEIVQSEEDFHLDLKKMNELYNASYKRPAQSTLNEIFARCLKIKIELLEQVGKSMPHIESPQNDLQLHTMLQYKTQEVKKFYITCKFLIEKNTNLILSLINLKTGITEAHGLCKIVL